MLGRWVRVGGGDCADAYPADLEFDSRGIYRGQASPDARQHPVWDSGGYHVVADGRVRISTSTDAEPEYAFSSDGSTLTFTTPDGCVVTYQRAG
jgi:hypothetical protein